MRVQYMDAKLLFRRSSENCTTNQLDMMSLWEKRALSQSEVSISIWGVEGLPVPTRVSGVKPPVSSLNHPPVSSQKGQEGYLGCLKPTMPPISTATSTLNFTADFPPKNYIFSHQTPYTNSQTVAKGCLPSFQTSWGIALSSNIGPHN